MHTARSETFAEHMTRRSVEVIGVASGLGALDPGCQDGPDVLRALGFLHDMELPPRNFAWREMIRVPPAVAGDGLPEHLVRIVDVARRLAIEVSGSLAYGGFPIIIGGDHSCAIGTWSGAHTALSKHGRIGLIWIDAHMDSHTFHTSPSKALHGMSLACLLGHGAPGLINLAGMGPKLRPEDVCLIGVRSYESGEATLLRNLGVRVYFMEEVRVRGMASVFREAWGIVNRHTSSCGISIDLDVLDPDEEPGVGSPVPDGLRNRELMEALREVRDAHNLRVLEVVEYNPYADREFVTARAVHDICQVVAS